MLIKPLNKSFENEINYNSQSILTITLSLLTITLSDINYNLKIEACQEDLEGIGIGIGIFNDNIDENGSHEVSSA